MMILRIVGTVLGALVLAPLAAITTLLCAALRPPGRRVRQRRQSQIFCVGTIPSARATRASNETV